MSVKEEAVNRAVRILEAAGARYHISLEDKEFGEALKKTHTKRGTVNVGVCAYVREHVSNMNVGDIAIVPFGPYERRSLQGNVASEVYYMYGPKKCITHTGETGIEVLRVE